MGFFERTFPEFTIRRREGSIENSSLPPPQVGKRACFSRKIRIARSRSLRIFVRMPQSKTFSIPVSRREENGGPGIAESFRSRQRTLYLEIAGPIIDTPAVPGKLPHRQFLSLSRSRANREARIPFKAFISPKKTGYASYHGS